MVRRVKIVTGKFSDGDNQEADDTLPKEVFDTLEDIEKANVIAVSYSALGSGYGQALMVWDGTSTTTTTTTSTSTTTTTTATAPP